MSSLFVGVAEAAEFLGVAKITVYRMVKAGQLQHVKMGRRIMIPVAVIKKLALIDDDSSN